MTRQNRAENPGPSGGRFGIFGLGSNFRVVVLRSHEDLQVFAPGVRI